MAQKKAATRKEATRKEGTRKAAAKKSGAKKKAAKKSAKKSASRTTKKAGTKKASAKKSTSTTKKTSERGTTRKSTSSEKKSATTTRAQASSTTRESTPREQERQEVVTAPETAIAVAEKPAAREHDEHEPTWEAADAASLLEMEPEVAGDPAPALEVDMARSSQGDDTEEIDLEIVVEAEKRVTEQELGLLGVVQHRAPPTRGADDDPELPELRAILHGVLGSEDPSPVERRITLWLSAAFGAGLLIGLVIGWAF